MTSQTLGSPREGELHGNLLQVFVMKIGAQPVA
jgi:hypothetical protein